MMMIIISANDVFAGSATATKLIYKRCVGCRRVAVETLERTSDACAQAFIASMLVLVCVITRIRNLLRSCACSNQGSMQIENGFMKFALSSLVY
eukprot:3029851-Pleurochrysis_carterae.AAC.3